MASSLLAALYAPVLTTSFLASRMGLAARRPRHWPWATTVALLVVGIPTLAQFTVAPWLFENLQRDWTLIGRGQVWRLLTALVVQDGGLVGALFNLLALAAIGVAAEQVLGGEALDGHCPGCGPRSPVLGEDRATSRRREFRGCVRFGRLRSRTVGPTGALADSGWSG
jgi:hypothetical protein